MKPKKVVKPVKAWGLMKWNKRKQEYLMLPFASITQNKLVNSAETNSVGVYKIVRVEIKEVRR